MKKLISLILLFVAIQGFAQTRGEFVVADIRGTLHRQMGKTRELIEKGMYLEGTDILVLGENTTVVLLEPKNGIRYTLKGPYAGSSRNYIQRYAMSGKKISDTYMNFLLSQAFDKRKSTKGSNENSQATVFREGNSIFEDSVTMSIKSVDSLYRTIDSLIVKPDTLTAIPDSLNPQSIKK